MRNAYEDWQLTSYRGKYGALWFNPITGELAEERDYQYLAPVEDFPEDYEIITVGGKVAIRPIGANPLQCERCNND